MKGVLRGAVLVAGVIFCVLFGAATLYTMSEEEWRGGILLFGGVSLLIDVMILLGLVGAILHPPDRR